MNKKQFKQFLYEICEDCDCHNDVPYCTLAEFIISAHQSHRLLMQMKCIEKFKYELHADISWNDAFGLWVEKGYAKTFGDLYNEEMKFQSLYRKVIHDTEEK